MANADGSLKAEYSYDAWGRLRNPATQVAYTPGSEPALFLARGYTGHEHLPWFGLVNMNARLYDAALGRFLSPDPYVQNPSMTQNFNRYTYAMNNPLVYVDLSGEKWWKWLLGDILTGGLISTTAITTGVSAYSAVFPFTNQGYEMQKLVSPAAFKPNFHFGGDVKGLGFDVSVGTPNLSPVSYRYHYGQTYYSLYYDNAFSGKETRRGAEWSVNGYSFGMPRGITYSGTRFESGGISQTTNMITIGNPFVNVQYENDFMFDIRLPGIPKADNGDRWRTAAVQINFAPFSMGTNMMTGDPGLHDRPYVDGAGIHEGRKVYSGEHANDYRFGSFYFGIGPFRYGTNNEQNRHIFQNIFAHDIITKGDSKHFQFMYNRPWRKYWYIGTGTGNTLW